MNKRGLSAVVVTLILVLLVLVSISVVWVVIKNILTKSAEDISIEKTTANLDIQDVKTDDGGTPPIPGDDEIIVKVKRSPGSGEVIGLRFIFKNTGGKTEIVEITTTIKELEEKSFTFNAINDITEININEIEEVSVIPLLKISSGKTSAGFSDESPVTAKCTDADSDSYYLKGKDCGNEDCNDMDGSIYVFKEGYLDSDGDDYGIGNLEQVCTDDSSSTGFADVGGDCDDTNGAKQVFKIGYIDNDNDGYGTGTQQQICTGVSSSTGLADVGGDCLDSDANVHPGAFEICDNTIDEDCANGDLSCAEFLKSNYNLVSWWKFDDTLSDEITDDETTNNLDGTCTSCPAFITTGKFGNAYDFNGVDNYIKVNNPADGSLNFYNKEMTIMIWVNYIYVSGSKTFFSKSDSTKGYRLSVDNQALFAMTGGGTFYRRSFSVIDDETWHHIAVTKNSGNNNLNIYIDGALNQVDPYGSLTSTTDNTQYLGIGTETNNGPRFYLDGAIDELMIFNKVLTQEEIAKIKNQDFQSLP